MDSIPLFPPSHSFMRFLVISLSHHLPRISCENVHKLFCLSFFHDFLSSSASIHPSLYCLSRGFSLHVLWFLWEREWVQEGNSRLGSLCCWCSSDNSMGLSYSPLTFSAITLLCSRPSVLFSLFFDYVSLFLSSSALLFLVLVLHKVMPYMNNRKELQHIFVCVGKVLLLVVLLNLSRPELSPLVMQKMSLGRE